MSMHIRLSSLPQSHSSKVGRNTSVHPDIHLEMSTWLVFFQRRAITCLIATPLEIVQILLLLPVSKGLIDLTWPASTWKTYATFIGKTHVRELPDPSPSSSFAAIFRWGRDVACLPSKAENVILSRDINAHLEKKPIDVDQGKSQHWGLYLLTVNSWLCAGWNGRLHLLPCFNLPEQLQHSYLTSDS